MTTKIVIIGGGVSGITTALTLQLLGYETKVYAEHLVDKQASKDPRFASLYPAASIIPHSLQTDKTDLLFPPSRYMFERLLENGVKGVHLNRHYELFEKKVSDPPYAKFLTNYARVGELNSHSIPHRTKSAVPYGWAFDCLFAEWPTYMHNLYSWYRKAGGTIIRKRVEADEISNLESNIIVNCCGIWSPEVFEDSMNQQVVKGHLLHIKNAPLLKDSSGTILSYNYTAGKTIYTNPSGEAADVYLYPRSDGWILGGSRLPCTLDKRGTWTGKEATDTISIDGLEIPRQIYDLNRKIIKNTFDINIEQFSDISSKVGYRFLREHPVHGLRLGETKEYGKRVIHNYGHGGAGVTLSWGCALFVTELILRGKVESRKETLDMLTRALLSVS